MKKLFDFKRSLVVLVIVAITVFLVVFVLMQNDGNSIEDYYLINKQYVDNFYDISTEEINYENIELNFKAYPLIVTSMGIEVENIDLVKVDDIRPLLDEHYNKLISDGYTNEIDNIKTNQDYFDFMELQVVPEDIFILLKKTHPVLEEYEPGEMTYKEINELTNEINTWENCFSSEEIEYFKMKNIALEDGLFLIHIFNSLENIEKNSDSEIVKILTDEYLYKQKVCKKYLAIYSINKIYGNDN